MDKTSGKDSVEIGVYENGKLVPVGHCTTTGKDVPDNPEGVVLDIKSFGFQKDHIRSATWVRTRPDLRAKDVTMRKLVDDIKKARKTAPYGE
jgi:hypothetical protein